MPAKPRATTTTAKKAAQPYHATHPSYNSAMESWEKVRDVVAGAKAVKAKGVLYLPSLHDQSVDDYNRYRKRAVFFGAPGRTQEALVGLLMRKSPEMKASADVEAITADVDMQGSTLNDYVRDLSRDMVSIGRGGSLVDWSAEEGRPYWVYYVAEAITNWDTARIDGRIVLTLLTLKEDGFEVNPDTLAHDPVTTYRIFRLTDEGVTVTKHKDGESADGVEPELLTRRNIPLHFIPFVFHGLNSNKPEPGPVPLEMMAEVSISHYCTSADLENGRHFAGLPTPYAFGFDPKKKLVMGTSNAWVSQDHEAKVGYLEFQGQGLTELREALKEKQEQMAILGARMIEPEKREAEAYGTVKLRADAEQATLVNVAEVESAGISLLMQISAWWAGTAAEPTDYAETDYFVMATDFVTGKMDGTQLTALVGAHQMGSISYHTFFYNLQQGEIFPDGWTAEQEIAAIQSGPMLTPPAAPGTGEDDDDATE